jgi:hypothetical protein
VDPNYVPWYKDENYQIIVNASVVGGIFLLLLLTVVRPMIRRLTSPEIDPKKLANAAAEAASLEAKMAIEVATAEAAAAQFAARTSKQAHEDEIAVISQEAVKAAAQAAQMTEAARLAAEAKLAADALAAAEAKAREEAMIAEAKAREEALQAELAAKLAEAEAAAHAAAQAAAVEGEQAADQDIEIEEGETLEEVKARMASLKPKKQSISADLLNTANSYDDKVALIRMIVAEDSTRVAGVLKSLIQ